MLNKKKENRWGKENITSIWTLNRKENQTDIDTEEEKGKTKQKSGTRAWGPEGNREAVAQNGRFIQ